MKNKYVFCLLLLTQLQNFAFGASIKKKASIPARPVPTDSQKAYILAILDANKLGKEYVTLKSGRWLCMRPIMPDKQVGQLFMIAEIY